MKLCISINAQLSVYREKEPARSRTEKEMQVRTGGNLSCVLMRDGIKSVPFQNGFRARKYEYRQEVEQYVQYL